MVPSNVNILTYSGINVKGTWYLVLGDNAVAEIISDDIDPRPIAQALNDAILNTLSANDVKEMTEMIAGPIADIRSLVDKDKK